MKKWLDERILFFAWSFIILICFIIILTSPVKAAEPEIDLPLTIGIPDILFSQTGLNQTIVDNCVNEYLSILANQYSFDGSSDYTCFVADRQGTILTIVVTFDMNCGYIPIQAPTRSLPGGWSSIYYTNQSQHYVQFTFDGSTGTLSSGSFSGGWVSTWSFNRSDLSIGKGWVLSSVNEFPEYWVFPEEVVDTNGHATPPINNNGHYIPNPHPNKPTPNIFTPSSPQFPSVDTSTLEKLVESLIDIVQYGFSYTWNLITGYFNNLVSNISTYFDYIGDLLIYGFNNVVGSIQDFASDFYNNMVSLFEPISKAINYIGEPISGTVIYDNLSNTGIITNYNSIVSTVTGFQDGFTNLSEPSEFKIPIHLENLPSSYFGTLTTQYIDLSVINPVKGIIRAFLWALITYSLFVTIIDSIANYINGGGDE